METKKDKIALFFNSERGISVYKSLNRNYSLDIFLSKKNLKRKVKTFLKKKKIKFKLIDKVNIKLIKKMKNKDYFLIISSGFPLIFPENFLKIFKNRVINLHAGPLPEYRGGSPLNWQIINGEKMITISIIQMSKKIDHGPIYSEKSFKLKKSDTIKTVHEKVNYIFPYMLHQVILKIKNKMKPKKQKKSNIKNYPQRSKKDGYIDWKKKDALEVYNFVRALTKPYPGAFYLDKEKKIKTIFKCKISKKNPRIEPGQVFYSKGEKFIKCKKYSIKIIQT